MKRVLLGSVLAAMALVSFQASADEFAPNRSEVNISGSIDNTSGINGGPSSTTTFISGSYGYYFTPQLLGTVSTFLASQSTGGTTNFSLFDVGVGAKYYFIAGKKGELTPWAEGEFALATAQFAGGNSASGHDISGAIGATYWVTESAGPFVDARLKSTSLTSNGFTYTVNDTILEFGVTIKF